MVGKYHLPRLDNQLEEHPLLTYISNSVPSRLLVKQGVYQVGVRLQFRHNNNLKISFCLLRYCRNGMVFKCLNGIKAVITSITHVFPQNHIETY